ncbi:MAG TPA: hypothetical protein VL549_07095 [Gemmatimonadales bacterium]|jgi:hypothetical protein|nr:hypothetical protein [Gemmatimonadales bacterium]
MRTVIAATSLAVVMACSSDSTGPDLTPVPPAPAHVYVADLSGAIFVFAAPLTSASVPIDTIPNSGPLGIAVDDSGNIAVSATTKKVYLYHKPLSSSSAPADSVPSSPYFGFPAYGPDGKLYVATQGTHVLVYSPPIASASVADTIKNSLVDAYSVGFDRQRRLYVDDPAGGGVRVYESPYTGPPAFSVDSGMGATQGMALDASGRLLVANYSFDKIYIYAAPLSGASEPVDSITSGLHSPEAIAIGGDGYLYVANESDSAIVVYHPPFSHASTPAVNLRGHGLVTPWGLAVGK